MTRRSRITRKAAPVTAAAVGVLGAAAVSLGATIDAAEQKNSPVTLQAEVYSLPLMEEFTDGDGIQENMYKESAEAKKALNELERNSGKPFNNVDREQALDTLWIKKLKDREQEWLKANQERHRQEKLQRLEREQSDRERWRQEKLQRLERERLERERLERERLERERLERERREQLEREQLEREQLERERLEREQLERERLEEETKLHALILQIEEKKTELKNAEINRLQTHHIVAALRKLIEEKNPLAEKILGKPAETIQDFQSLPERVFGMWSQNEDDKDNDRETFREFPRKVAPPYATIFDVEVPVGWEGGIYWQEIPFPLDEELAALGAKVYTAPSDRVGDRILYPQGRYPAEVGAQRPIR